jgi:uncharacterized metal-binding protein
MIDCSTCKTNQCYHGKECAKGYDFTKYKNISNEEYKKQENIKILKTASKIEAEHYMKWTRLEEIIGFCKDMDYRKIGIAMCVGLVEEVCTLKKILSKDFTVVDICCKSCGFDKNEFNVPHIKSDRYEATCNPIAQALILNGEKTDLNIIVGLCIGHDILFTKYSEAPVTTFIVKDRVLGHNTGASLYSKYYLRKFL